MVFDKFISRNLKSSTSWGMFILLMISSAGWFSRFFMLAMNSLEELKIVYFFLFYIIACLYSAVLFVWFDDIHAKKKSRYSICLFSAVCIVVFVKTFLYW